MATSGREEGNSAAKTYYLWRGGENPLLKAPEGYWGSIWGGGGLDAPNGKALTAQKSP